VPEDEAFVVDMTRITKELVKWENQEPKERLSVTVGSGVRCLLSQIDISPHRPISAFWVNADALEGGWLRLQVARSRLRRYFTTKGPIGSITPVHQ